MPIMLIFSLPSISAESNGSSGESTPGSVSGISGTKPDGQPDCFICHGQQGIPPPGETPVIAGFPRNFIINYLTNSKTGKHPNPLPAHAQANEAWAKKMAEHFKKQPWKSWNNRKDKEKAQQGKSLVIKAHCEKCHEDGGMTQDDDTPRVAGQKLNYLLNRIEAFKSGTQSTIPEKMLKNIKNTSKDDLEAIGHYWGSNQ